MRCRNRPPRRRIRRWRTGRSRCRSCRASSWSGRPRSVAVVAGDAVGVRHARRSCTPWRRRRTDCRPPPSGPCSSRHRRRSWRSSRSRRCTRRAARSSVRRLGAGLIGGAGAGVAADVRCDAQRPCGSATPAPTEVQVPALPVTLQAWQRGQALAWCCSRRRRRSCPPRTGCRRCRRRRARRALWHVPVALQ